MNDEMLIRQFAQIKALQSVTLHLQRLVIESFTKNDMKVKFQELLAAVEVQCENNLRDDLQLPRLPDEYRAEPREDIFDWPDIVIDNDKKE